MSNQIQVFNNKQFGSVRVIEREGEPWFVGRDVAGALGYENPTKAIRDHVDEDDKMVGAQNVTPPIKDSLGRDQYPTYINESGLYSLVMSSKLPAARSFKRWATHEVIPSIRKHGAYMTPAKIEEVLSDPDTIIQLATQLKAEREERKALAEKVEADAPKVIFADSVETSKQSILVGQLAKQLRQNGVNIGQQRLFKRLREDGYLCSAKGDRYNMPTQRAMEQGLFEIKERTVNNPDGSVRITCTPKITGKGQIFLTNKYMQEDVQMTMA